MKNEAVLDCHQSGKWSVDVDVLLKRLDALVDMGYDIIRLTEVSPKKFWKALRRWAKKHHWHVQHPRRRGANECAILSRKPIRRRAAWKATDLQLKVGRTAPTFIVGAEVQGAGWCTVLHTPAHTEGLRKGLWTTKVYLSVVDFFHARRKRKRETLSADFNMDLKLTKNRLRVAAWFPHMRLAVPRDQKNNEGGRVIDGFVTTDQIVQSGVTHTEFSNTALDHLPVGIKRRNHE